jgi:hypothetical protein
MRYFDGQDNDNDLTKYKVTLFMTGGMTVPFIADEVELYKIAKQHSRPDFLKPRNFGVTTGDGHTKIKVDLRKVFVIEATELGHLPQPTEPVSAPNAGADQAA